VLYQLSYLASAIESSRPTFGFFRENRTAQAREFRAEDGLADCLIARVMTMLLGAYATHSLVRLLQDKVSFLNGE
jgi:hypothetical protein